jgi:hypothetical protein
MDMNEMKRRMQTSMEKIAAGDTTQIDPMDAYKDGAETNTKVLAQFFNHKEGLAQNSKKELNKYFDTSNPMYTMRKQSLIEKVAHFVGRK